jgi:hypothetical protein
MSKMHESMNTIVSLLIDDTKDKSFMEYVAEASAMITPPSGQTVGPSASGAGSPAVQKGTAPGSNMKAIWPGKGAPIEMGMTVGLKGPNGLPVPGEVTQVDMSSNGVKVKNPTTGQEEWQNNDALEPFATQQGQSGQPQQQGQTQPQQNIQTQEDKQLMRLKELAGIREDASCGASSAGSIAIAPAAMGKVKRRQETDEAAMKKEYTPTVAKTVVGDTKPAQASGALSANLAASGKKSAGRINNGRKRR